MDQQDKDILEDAPLQQQPTPEEIAAAAEDELLARRIRREVKRIESGEADDDLAKDAAEEEQQRAEEEAKEAEEQLKQQRRANKLYWKIISGNILKETVAKYYSQLTAIAALMFVSIVVMFWSLHLDMRYNQELRNVQLLRERSARLQELRYSKCSHSAISAELRRKGSKLEDATHPAMVVESKGWFNR